MPEWMNVDLYSPADIVCNLEKGLPFIPDCKFDYVYSEHFFEHIPRRSSSELVRECFRILKPNGKIRIAVPDLEGIIKDYLSGRSVPEVHEECANIYGDVLGTRGELFDIAMRGWGHTYMYNFEDISLLLKAAGFREIQRMELKKSHVPFLENRETRLDSTLIVEAKK